MSHAAADGVPLAGALHLPARRDPDTVVLAMHPRVDFSQHYLVPHMVGAGYAFMGSRTRHLNNDADALHERLLLDVAGTVAWLRERGFAKVLLLGNSGGGSLFAFYLAQAGMAPGARLAHAPSGDRVPLRDVELPLADGLVLLAVAPGERRQVRSGAHRLMAALLYDALLEYRLAVKHGRRQVLAEVEGWLSGGTDGDPV